MSSGGTFEWFGSNPIVAGAQFRSGATVAVGSGYVFSGSVSGGITELIFLAAPLAVRRSAARAFPGQRLKNKRATSSPSLPQLICINLNMTPLVEIVENSSQDTITFWLENFLSTKGRDADK